MGTIMRQRIKKVFVTFCLAVRNNAYLVLHSKRFHQSCSFFVLAYGTYVRSLYVLELQVNGPYWQSINKNMILSGLTLTNLINLSMKEAKFTEGKFTSFVLKNGETDFWKI